MDEKPIVTPLIVRIAINRMDYHVVENAKVRQAKKRNRMKDFWHFMWMQFFNWIIDDWYIARAVVEAM